MQDRERSTYKTNTARWLIFLFAAVLVISACRLTDVLSRSGPATLAPVADASQGGTPTPGIVSSVGQSDNTVATPPASNLSTNEVPTPEVQASDTPDSGSVVEPASVPTDQGAGYPTDTPYPTDTEYPTETDVPTDTPYPTATGYPTATNVPSRITLVLDPTSIVADDSDYSTAEATVYDSNSNPLSDQTVTITANPSSYVSIDTVFDNGDGTYSADITASTTAGSVTITACDGSVCSAAQTLTLVAATATPSDTPETTGTTTATPTSTNTPTAILSPTNGPSPTPTDTSTPTLSPTPTNTPTLTPSPTPTVMPAVPILLSPTPGATFNTTHVQLDWADSSGATYYRVQVRKNSPTGNPILDTLTTSSEYQLPVSTGKAKYYWRVWACNSAVCSSWSANWYFSVQ